METKTQVKTSSITGTKLAIATIAVVLAGGAALASVPLKPKTNTRFLPITVDSCRIIRGGGVVVEREISNDEECLNDNTDRYVCLNENTFRLIQHKPCTGPITQSHFSDYYVNGSCVQLNDGVSLTETYKNGCVGKDNLTYICKGGNSVVVEVSACKATTPFCLDEDGGENLFTKGTAGIFYPNTKKFVRVGTDSCSGTNVVQEQVCNGATVETKSIRCPEGFACKDGQCDRKSLVDRCTDNDGGVDLLTVSNARSINLNTGEVTQVNDTCFSDRAVSEAICSASGVTSINVVCGTKQKCVDGACQLIDMNR